MKTLIVYASLGEGHKKAAFAVKDHLGGADCRDILDFCPPVIKKLQQSIYLYLTQKAPFLWQVMFRAAGSKLVLAGLEKANRLIFAAFTKYLRENKPELIITTHFFPLGLIAPVKWRLDAKVIVVVTDTRSHPIWAHECADTYITPTEAGKKDLVERGIKEERITSGYVALREGFLKEIDPAALRRKFSLDEKPGILFMASGTGKLPFLEKVLAELPRRFNVFVIYGKNEKLKKTIKRASGKSIKGFPFYENIWELVRLSSVIVAKPGGLTVFEGVFCRKPFVFTHFIPGQEKANMDLLVSLGVARYARSKQEMLEAIDYFYGKEKELRENYPLEFKDIRQINFFAKQKN